MVQSAPELQATQPASAAHTAPPSALHDEPAGRWVVMAHIGEPELHWVAPLWHGPGLHPASATQLLQVPLPLHTPPGHATPAPTLLEESTHTGAPLEQLVVPTLHTLGLPLQLAPGAHGTQLPLPLHTPPEQAVPGALAAASTHTGAPLEHCVVPSLQALFGLVVHAWPAVQATHCCDGEQTWLLPHEVPAGFAAPSTQAALPVAHETTPLKHALLGLVVQLPPAVQVPQPPTPSHS